MARERKIEIGALNITTHPHSPKKYLELFKRTRRLRLIKKIRSDKWGMLTSVNYLNKDKYGKLGPIYGDIYRFTQIDTDGTWFNTQTIDKAEDDDLASISIPQHLKPNSSRFSYIFFPESHIMFYEQYYDGHTFGHSNAATLIDRLFNDQKLEADFGKVDVISIPCMDELEKALGMEKLERLDMKIRRPNPDDQSDAEKEVLKRMNALQVEEQKQEYKAIPGHSIEPDKTLKILAKIAAKFGHVHAKGKDQQSRPVEYTTSKHPWKDKLYYDPVIENAFDMLVVKVLTIKDELISLFK
jgi:hypothetical protein